MLWSIKLYFTLENNKFYLNYNSIYNCPLFKYAVNIALVAFYYNLQIAKNNNNKEAIVRSVNNISLLSHKSKKLACLNSKI